jgi:NAD(P)-dependent dehydrogenase (short-subunit alcohol dehydrogenase family)
MRKNVLITRANGGIGKALCKAFVEAGYFVIP